MKVSVFVRLLLKVRLLSDFRFTLRWHSNDHARFDQGKCIVFAAPGMHDEI
jgi:hypothetical protein